MNNTIMIVDDQKLNIELLAESLGDEYNIMPVISGESAIKLLRRKKPDLVLLDVSMPDIDGFEVLRFMKETEELANIPVIFVTGEHETEMEEKGLALGAVDYVKKPFNTTVVKVKVQNHIELKAYRDNLESLVQVRTRQLSVSREAIIMGMSLMSEIHDSVTGSHVKRIKDYTRLLARAMSELCPDLVTSDLANEIELYSPLHDVGKVAISDTILKKKGILTSEEFEVMKSHTLQGAELLRKTEEFLVDDTESVSLSVAIEIAECHHEKYDGTGYPYGLKGDDIPISARIVALADIYDALRSIRPYKEPLTHEEAVHEIYASGDRTNRRHFDPTVLKAFEIVQDEWKKIYE